MPVPIALELYSTRDLYRENFEACLERTKEMGYEGVECFGAPTLPASRVAQALKTSGLALAGWHTPIDILEGDALSSTVDYFRAIGNTRAIVPWVATENFSTRESVLAFAKRMNGIAKQLAPHGISLGYHNHDAEFRPLPDGTLPWVLLMDNTSIIAQLDNGNALSSKTQGLDPTNLVAQWPGRAETVHLKPYSTEKGFETMIGEDDIDWLAFLTAAEIKGGSQWFIVEYEAEACYSQLEGAEKCLRALKKML